MVLENILSEICVLFISNFSQEIFIVCIDRSIVAGILNLGAAFSNQCLPPARQMGFSSHSSNPFRTTVYLITELVCKHTPEYVIVGESEMFKVMSQTWVIYLINSKSNVQTRLMLCSGSVDKVSRQSLTMNSVQLFVYIYINSFCGELLGNI